MMFVLDSNVIIAFFREQEERHQEAVDFMSGLEHFAITDHVLSEVATVLMHKEGIAVAREVLEFLVQTEGIELYQLNDTELDETLWRFAHQKKPRCSFVDMSLIVFAKERGFRLATFDKHLSQSAREM